MDKNMEKANISLLRDLYIRDISGMIISMVREVSVFLRVNIKAYLTVVKCKEKACLNGKMDPFMKETIKEIERADLENISIGMVKHLKGIGKMDYDMETVLLLINSDKVLKENGKMESFADFIFLFASSSKYIKINHKKAKFLIIIVNLFHYSLPKVDIYAIFNSRPFYSLILLLCL